MKEKIATQSKDNESKNNKDINVVSKEMLSCWKSSPKCIINMTEFLKRTKSYEHLIKEYGLLVNPVVLQKVEELCQSL